MGVRKSIITIAGKPGSGKSTTADAVARSLGYERFSSGSLMREMSKKRGVSINNLNKVAENDPEIDRFIDEYIRKIGKTRGKLVIDSRTAYHWIPDSFKVYLELNTRIAAGRIKSDPTRARKRAGESDLTAEELEKKIKERLASEQRRYLKYYELDISDLSPFDLIIDTSKHPLNEVVNMIIKKY